MHFSTFSVRFALRTCRFDSALWKIIPLLLDEGNKVEFFRRTKNEVWVSRKNSTLFPESSKSGIIFHSKLSNLQVTNAKPTEKVEKCIKLKSFLIFLAERTDSLTINCQDCALSYASSYILWSLQPFSFRPKLLINTTKKQPICLWNQSPQVSSVKKYSALKWSLSIRLSITALSITADCLYLSNDLGDLIFEQAVQDLEVVWSKLS